MKLSHILRRAPDAPSLRERAAGLQAGLARIAQRTATHEPAKAIGATSPAPADPPPTLAAACDWGVAHMAWINDTGHPDGEWPDDRLTAEIRRFDAVLNRAAHEPSQGIGDVAAKARAVFADWRGTLDRKSPSTSERALLTLLREVGALSPSAVSPLYQDAAAEGRILAAGGIDHHDGTMSYCDAAGAVVRHPVARWVAFTAAQIHSKVQAEIARQRIAANALQAEEYEAWEAQVSRELRADAVSALAVRSDRVFEAAQTMRAAGRPVEPSMPDVLAAAIIGAPGSQAPADDAVLIALEAEFLATDAAFTATALAAVDAWNAYVEPPMPKELRVWSIDWIYKAIPRTRIVERGGACRAEPYGEQEVEQMRGVRCLRRSYGQTGEPQPDGTRATPDTVAQERVDSIVAAWDRWQAQIAGAKAAVNLPQMGAAREEARQARDAVLQRVRETTASGLAGLAIKARIAANMLCEIDPKASALLDGPDDTDGMLLDLAGDVLALTGGLPAAHRLEG